MYYKDLHRGNKMIPKIHSSEISEMHIYDWVYDCEY